MTPTPPENYIRKKYKIIYADPPWSYVDKALSGKRGASSKYPTQSKEWIEALPIKEIADKDCVLFLWCTMPKLNEVFDLIEKWGFTYKTVAFVWIKKNRGGGRQFYGNGSLDESERRIMFTGNERKTEENIRGSSFSGRISITGPQREARPYQRSYLKTCRRFATY